MHNSVMPTSGGTNSPFDRVKNINPETGAEYWSARDLMQLMGYSAWQNFQVALKRAMKSAEVQNMDVTSNFMGSHKISNTKPQQDFHLTRFAAYLVAMNGDPNKPEVASAQAYFATKTRQAETTPIGDDVKEAIGAMTRSEILQIAMNAETERLALEAKNKVLEPKADAYDDFLDATGKYNIGAVAKMLGRGQNWLFRELRNTGVLISKGAMRNTPYQQYMNHFEVKAHMFERSNGEQGVSYTTYVQPSGIDFIRRKLGLVRIDPVIPGVE